MQNLRKLVAQQSEFWLGHERLGELKLLIKLLMQWLNLLLAELFGVSVSVRSATYTGLSMQLPQCGHLQLGV